MILLSNGIWTVTEISRTILLHAQRYWPECVDTMITPFAVKADIEIFNFLQLDLDGNNTTTKFNNNKNINTNAYKYHTFGYPIYVLNYKLQSGSIGPPKLEPRSRVGVYLIYSPMHAGFVAIILNPVNRHLSPKYHVV